MINTFHHVGFAARDLEKTLGFFESVFGAKVLWRSRLEAQHIESVLITVGSARIELLGSLDPQSLIAKFVAAKGEGLHHVSLEVSNFDQTIADFKAKGLNVIGEADTDDFKAAFLHPQSMFGMLTELIEPKGQWSR